MNNKPTQHVCDISLEHALMSQWVCWWRCLIHPVVLGSKLHLFSLTQHRRPSRPNSPRVTIAPPPPPETISWPTICNKIRRRNLYKGIQSRAKYNTRNHRKIIVWNLTAIRNDKFNKSLYIYILCLWFRISYYILWINNRCSYMQ